MIYMEKDITAEEIFSRIISSYEGMVIEMRDDYGLMETVTITETGIGYTSKEKYLFIHGENRCGGPFATIRKLRIYSDGRVISRCSLNGLYSMGLENCYSRGETLREDAIRNILCDVFDKWEYM